MSKHFIPIKIILLAMFALMACAARSTEPHDYSIDFKMRVYEVFGMDCPGCHGGVENLIKKIPAVQDAKANWQKKILTVWIKPGAVLNDDDIFDAIKKANFTPGKRIK